MTNFVVRAVLAYAVGVAPDGAASGSEKSKMDTAFAVMLSGALGAIGTIVFAVDWVPGSVTGVPDLPSRRVAGLWLYNGVLCAALIAWLVCTYFCLVDGYDNIPAVRNSLCLPHVAATV